eukprot:GAHX01003386.1.p1 GENE.GAHX01003386.1~~GAHX01003386.1.p1  ORF type:complete len:150 (+),score=34.66 GAHX01003386.1:153-602(+)
MEKSKDQIQTSTANNSNQGQYHLLTSKQDTKISNQSTKEAPIMSESTIIVQQNKEELLEDKLNLKYLKDNTKQACMMLKSPGSFLFIKHSKFGKTTFKRIIELIAEGPEKKNSFKNTWVYNNSTETGTTILDKSINRNGSMLYFIKTYA